MTELMRWFPFYVDRFLTSNRVRRMDAQRIGVYVLLLLEQWDHQAVSDADADLIVIGKAPIDVVREVLAACFRRRRKGWINDALEKVRMEQYARAERLRNAGQIAGFKSAAARRAKRSKTNNLERPLNDRQTTVERPSNDRATTVNQESRREESRGEEITATATAARARARARAWKFVPQDWKPTSQHIELAKQLHIDLRAEEAIFRDHEFKAPKTDADRAFARWLRTAKTMNSASEQFRPPAKGIVKTHAPLPEDGPEPTAEERAEGLRLVQQAVTSMRSVPSAAPTIEDPAVLKRRQAERKRQLAIARGENP